MSVPRVVITATGAVCSSGKSPGEILAAVRAGRSTIAPIQQWDVTNWPTKQAGEIANFNPREMVEDHRRSKRAGLVLPGAGGELLEQARALEDLVQ